jgi:hypothetical protein
VLNDEIRSTLGGRGDLVFLELKLWSIVDIEAIGRKVPELDSCLGAKSGIHF